MEEITLHEEETYLTKEVVKEMSEIAELPVTENENLEAEVAGTSNDKADPGERDGNLDTEQLNETCKDAQEEDLMTKMIAKLKVLELLAGFNKSTKSFCKVLGPHKMHF